jgi:UDP-N-acetylmuramate-alanine ligase
MRAICWRTYTVATLLGEATFERAHRAERSGTSTWSFPGRAQQWWVIGIVDYAHTPDALKNVLTTINDVCGDERAGDHRGGLWR